MQYAHALYTRAADAETVAAKSDIEHTDIEHTAGEEEDDIVPTSTTTSTTTSSVEVVADAVAAKSDTEHTDIEHTAGEEEDDIAPTSTTTSTTTGSVEVVADAVVQTAVVNTAPAYSSWPGTGSSSAANSWPYNTTSTTATSTPDGTLATPGTQDVPATAAVQGTAADTRANTHDVCSAGASSSSVEATPTPLSAAVDLGDTGSRSDTTPPPSPPQQQQQGTHDSAFAPPQQDGAGDASDDSSHSCYAIVPAETPQTSSFSANLMVGAEAGSNPASDWGTAEVHDWVEEYELEDFEEDLEGWNGERLLTFARASHDDDDAIESAFDFTFSLFGTRERNRAIDAWQQGLNALLGCEQDSVGPSPGRARLSSSRSPWPPSLPLCLPTSTCAAAHIGRAFLLVLHKVVCTCMYAVRVRVCVWVARGCC